MVHMRVLLAACALGIGACSWATSVIAPQYSSPAEYGDVLIFSQRTGTHLFAVVKSSKEDLWKWSCDGRSVRTAPEIEGDIAFIWAGSCDDSRACAIDCKTGKSIWETPSSGWTFDPPSICGDVVLFHIEHHKNEIHAFDKLSGRLLWTRDDHELISVCDGTVLASVDGDTRVEILDATSGQSLFSTPFSTERLQDPQGCYGENGIAVVSCRGTILALDVRQRRLMWSKKTGGKRYVPAVQADSLFLLT